MQVGGGDMKKVKKQHLEHHAAMTLALECQIKMFQVERPAAFWEQKLSKAKCR